MKFCIAIMFQNEADWLALHLPILMQADIDGLIGLDGGSKDGSARVIRSHGGKVLKRAYDWPPIRQHNALIEMVEEAGYDAMVKIDPDELFFPEHIMQMKTLLSDHKVLRFPSYHFQCDRLHYAPAGQYYPDPHIRAWRLGLGLRYSGDFHSMIDYAAAGLKNPRKDAADTLAERDVLDVPHIHLFHYGDIKSREARALRSLNIQRFRDHLPPLDKLPSRVPPPPFHIRFTGPQPLDPAECGPRAPVE